MIIAVTPDSFNIVQKYFKDHVIICIDYVYDKHKLKLNTFNKSIDVIFINPCTISEGYISSILYDIKKVCHYIGIVNNSDYIKINDKLLQNNKVHVIDEQDEYTLGIFNHSI